jgi:1-acyl-sn-glycerol-3-phosphate acyltransferase
VSPTTLNAEPNRSTRDALIDAILTFIGRGHLLPIDDIRAALEREIDAAGAGALIALKAALSADDGWAYYPRNPLVQRVHHLLADRFLEADSAVTGREHLIGLDGQPLAIFANHLSYADANVVEVLLQRDGAAALAERLTAIAGPKVFTSRERRFSSLCFGTIKVPQSADVSSGEAQLTARDVARAARTAIGVANCRLSAGDALLLFAEGTRSRTASLQPMLAGVARYLEMPGTRILPAGLTGPEALFPVDSATVHPARVTLRFGAPFDAAALFVAASRDRRLVMDAIGLAIAELLPERYRGVYADAAAFADAASALNAVRGQRLA